jgi:hypothetical protein
MHTRRSLIAIASLLLLLPAAAPAARAEVAVETDAFGNYVRTSVYTQAALRQNKIWKIVRRNMPNVHPLNPTGDRQGDLYPFVAENLRNGRHPIVAWSRFNGIDYDIAWSKWTGTGWSEIGWVTTGIDAGDDYQPHLAFDNTGRPYIAWWRDHAGVGSVYVSFFLVSRWSPPILVSDEGHDSRAPRVFRNSGSSSMRVEYRTAAGFVSRLITLNSPTTITDDISPVGNVSISPWLTRTNRGGAWPGN